MSYLDMHKEATVKDGIKEVVEAVTARTVPKTSQVVCGCGLRRRWSRRCGRCCVVQPT